MESPNKSALARLAPFIIWTGLVAGLLAATVLRVHASRSDPFWLDELHTVWTVSHPTREIQQAAADGNQAPLYFWLLKAIVPEDTESPMAYRILSILSGVAAVLSLGWIVWYWTGNLGAAALSCCLAALDSNFIYYGSEARPYALLMLTAVWQFFWWAQSISVHDSTAEPQRKSGRWTTARPLIGLLLLSTILLLVHTTGILLLATELLVVVTLCAFHQFSRTRILTIAMILVAIAVSIGLQWFAVQQVAENRMQWSAISSARTMIDVYTPAIATLGTLPLILLFVANRARWVGKNQDHKLTPVTVVFCTLACGLGPMLVATLLDRLGWAPVAAYRYTVAGAILLPLFAGLLVSIIRQPVFQGTCILLILVASLIAPIPQKVNNRYRFRAANQDVLYAAGDILANRSTRRRFENWDSVILAIEPSSQPVFLFSNLLEDDTLASLEAANEQPDFQHLEYLKFPLTHSPRILSERVIPRPSHKGPAFQPTHLTQLSSSGGGWIVIRGDHAMRSSILSQLQQALNAREIPFVIHAFQPNEPGRIPEWLALYQVQIDAP